MNAGILLIRLVLGLTMAAHGAQKLFGWFGGYGPQGTGGFFGSLGFRIPVVMAVLAGLGEVGGGLGLAFGFLTPLAALAIATVMATAISTVHLPKGFWNGDGGYEFNLLIFATATGLAAVGAGRFSLDRAIGWDDNISGFWWGAGVAVAAVVISGLLVTLGRSRPALPEQAAT
jgi:putative oxidoreductase